MRKFILGLTSIVSIIALTPSCETDFSLNGDYKITPVVFGLLDQNNTTHMIKITKAYLGDGDNLVYAQNPDSNYFQQVDARIIEYVDSDPSGREWTLYDSTITEKDTSGIFYGPEQKLYVFQQPALNPDAEYEWQVELIPIVIDWTNHFYNSWHVHTNLLLPIRTDDNSSMAITGVFEQESGELPVSGTDNVDGVVDFRYRYYKISEGGDEEIEWTAVPHPLSQTITLSNISIADGDSVGISIKAIDVMNNTLDDDITVYVDSSPPIIDEIYLVKDGFRYLFVHDSTDLSEMNMTFVAYDAHRYV